jgi:hypothetical protein
MLIKAVRTTKIEIDTAKANQDNWIRASVQEVEVDSQTLEIKSESVTVHTVFRPVSKVALEQIQFVSPVTGEVYALYIADLAEAIKVAMVGWMVGDIPCHFDPVTNLVVIDDSPR